MRKENETVSRIKNKFAEPFVYACLSTDTKPTSVLNGSIMIEMDTNSVYMFDADGKQWLEIEA